MQPQRAPPKLSTAGYLGHAPGRHPGGPSAPSLSPSRLPPVVVPSLSSEDPFAPKDGVGGGSAGGFSPTLPRSAPVRASQPTAPPQPPKQRPPPSGDRAPPDVPFYARRLAPLLGPDVLELMNQSSPSPLTRDSMQVVRVGGGSGPSPLAQLAGEVGRRSRGGGRGGGAALIRWAGAAAEGMVSEPTELRVGGFSRVSDEPLIRCLLAMPLKRLTTEGGAAALLCDGNATPTAVRATTAAVKGQGGYGGRAFEVEPTPADAMPRVPRPPPKSFFPAAGGGAGGPVSPCPPPRPSGRCRLCSTTRRLRRLF